MEKKHDKSKQKKIKIDKSLKGVSSKSGSFVNITSFKLLKKLGYGAQGEVYMAEKVDGVDKGSIYAIKIFDKDALKKNEAAIMFVKNERMILERIVDCPFLTTMVYAFQSAAYLYIVLKFEQGGELYSVLQERPLSLNIAKFYLAEIVIALEQLHQRDIVYRDLKLENILFDGDGHIVVTDFGLSFDITKVSGDEVGRIGGTVQYIPPEAWDSDKPYGFAVDWWALGILAHELLTQKIPFSNFNEDFDNSETEKMRDMMLNTTIVISNDIHKDAKSFIEALLKVNVEERLGSVEGAIELKNHPFFKDIDWDLMYDKQFTPPNGNSYTDKYDTKAFDTKFTDTPIDFVDKPSRRYKSKTFPDFSFIAPQFGIKKYKKIPVNIELSMSIKDEPITPKKKKKKEMPKKYLLPLLHHMHREHIIRIGYIPNKDRPSLIQKRCTYKK